jgi:CRP/FNR family transcriptional regulator
MPLKESLHAFFPSFEEPLIDCIIKHGSLKKFQPGQIIMNYGAEMNHTMLITKGRVKIYTEGEEAEEFFMYHLEPGQACALSFICAARNKKSDLEAVAAEETEVILIPLDTMDEFMTRYRSWYYFVVESYRKRYQELLDALRSVAFHSMDERLEYYLIRQKNSSNNPILYITHEQIARDLNSSRVVISRLLKQMEIKGKVVLNRNSIELVAPK